MGGFTSGLSARKRGAAIQRKHTPETGDALAQRLAEASSYQCHGLGGPARRRQGTPRAHVSALARPTLFLVRTARQGTQTDSAGRSLRDNGSRFESERNSRTVQLDDDSARPA